MDEEEEPDPPREARERRALPGMEKGRERYVVFGASQAIAAMEAVISALP